MSGLYVSLLDDIIQSHLFSRPVNTKDVEKAKC